MKKLLSYLAILLITLPLAFIIFLGLLFMVHVMFYLFMAFLSVLLGVFLLNKFGNTN